MRGDRAIDRTRAPHAIRIGRAIVRFRGDASLVEHAMGPLAALEAPAAPAPTDIVVDVGPAPDSTPMPSAGTPPEAAVVFESVAGASRVRAPGIGAATLRIDGGLSIEVDPCAPPGDVVAERLTIPTLAERLRHAGIYLIHAAVLRVPSPGSGAVPDRRLGTVLVPAARGGGKTTLSLSLRRHGWVLLSDDRGWLMGGPELAVVDPWPEAPRVGDRSLFLLPRHAAAGPRDDRTGKAPAPGLTPPRVHRPFAVVGVLLPRLVEGAGGSVREARGARVLAAVASQMVVTTAPTTTSEALAFAATMMGRVPAFDVEVGDDPERLARAVARAFEIEQATGSTSGDRA